MGVLLGLAAALGWGVADFFIRSVTRELGAYATLFWMQLAGLVALVGVVLATGVNPEALGAKPGMLRVASLSTWGWACLAAVINLVASLALYRAFEVGVLAVVSPIAASYAAVTVVLSLLSGEHLGLLRGAGIGLVLLGVALTATTFGPGPKSSAGIGWAALSALAYGLTFWVLGFRVTAELGGVLPILVVRLLTPIMLALASRRARQPLGWPAGRVRWVLISVGLLDTAAMVANAVGLNLEQVAVVNVLASLYTVVTVVLAWLLLRERLRWTQWLGIATVMGGVVLVNR